MCVPVEKNSVDPAPGALPFLSYFNLACYGITVTAGQTGLPTQRLQQRNPVIVGLIPPQGLTQFENFTAIPSQLCVPIANNATDYPIPVFVFSLVQHLSFECFNTTTTPSLNVNGLTLDHLSPLLIDVGAPGEQVNVTQPQSVCVPVLDNSRAIPDTVRDSVKGVILRKHTVVAPAGQSLSPLVVDLKISHLNPLLAGMPEFSISSMTPQHLMLPLARFSAGVPAVDARGLTALGVLMAGGLLGVRRWKRRRPERCRADNRRAPPRPSPQGTQYPTW